MSLTGTGKQRHDDSSYVGRPQIAYHVGHYRIPHSMRRGKPEHDWEMVGTDFWTGATIPTQ
jgi:hypothetical protein